MHEQKATPDRLGAFSDAVLAVIITIMALELRAPAESVRWRGALHVDESRECVRTIQRALRTVQYLDVIDIE